MSKYISDEQYTRAAKRLYGEDSVYHAGPQLHPVVNPHHLVVTADGKTARLVTVQVSVPEWMAELEDDDE